MNHVLEAKIHSLCSVVRVKKHDWGLVKEVQGLWVRAPPMLVDTCVADTGWGNCGTEGTDVRMAKLFTVSPTRLYQARSDPAMRRISDQGSRAVIYRATFN